MIHPALKGKKMVFDVKGKPELAKAIVARLAQLGVPGEGVFLRPPRRIIVEGNRASYCTSGNCNSVICADTPVSILDDLYFSETSPLQLEVGKWYRSRDGKLRGPIQKSDHQWFLEYNDGDNSWTREGAYRAGIVCPIDLIEEVTHLPITLADGTTVEIPVAEHERLRGVK